MPYFVFTFGFQAAIGVASSHVYSGSFFYACMRVWVCGCAHQSLVQHFRVLARMTPALKEELATLLMEGGRTVLM